MERLTVQTRLKEKPPQLWSISSCFENLFHRLIHLKLMHQKINPQNNLAMWFFCSKLEWQCKCGWPHWRCSWGSQVNHSASVYQIKKKKKCISYICVLGSRKPPIVASPALPDVDEGTFSWPLRGQPVGSGNLPVRCILRPALCPYGGLMLALKHPGKRFSSPPPPHPDTQRSPAVSLIELCVYLHLHSNPHSFAYRHCMLDSSPAVQYRTK